MSTRTIRLPDDKHERLKALAKSNSISINKLMDEAALQTVGERVLVHGAGEYASDGIGEGGEALGGRALVYAEKAVVLPGEGVTEGVLEKAGRTDDERRLSEVFYYIQKLVLYLIGEAA